MPLKTAIEPLPFPVICHYEYTAGWDTPEAVCWSLDITGEAAEVSKASSWANDFVDVQIAFLCICAFCKRWLWR